MKEAADSPQLWVFYSCLSKRGVFGIEWISGDNQLNMVIMKFDLESTLPNIYHQKKQTTAIERFLSVANPIEKRKVY